MENTSTREVVLPIPHRVHPKIQEKVLYGRVRKELGEILREFWRRFEIDLVEGHARVDHIHLCPGIQPKYSELQSEQLPLGD